MKEISTIIDHYDRWKAEDKSMALATVVHTEASSYRRVGARMLVTHDGHWVGGISGGCLEGDALRRTQRVILNQRAEKHTYDTREGEDRVIGIGLGCEGRIDTLFSPIDTADDQNPVEQLKKIVNTRQPYPLYTLIQSSRPELTGKSFTDPARFTAAYPEEENLNWLAANERLRTDVTTLLTRAATKVLVEVIEPAVQLVVLGDNYDVIPLGKQCQLLGWKLKLVGTSRKFTMAHRNCSDELIDISQLELISIDTSTAVILMSHDYPKDLLGLRHFLTLTPKYLGLLGPVKRKQKLLKELGLNKEPAFLHGPVGLNIGAQTPEEIALSIVGDILKVFRDRPGGSLRTLRGSIYGSEEKINGAL